VHADRRVTFRFRAPNAKEVFVAREGAERLAMQKDDQGVWSATTQALEPDIYGYTFLADGVTLIDPSNHLTKPNLLWASSAVHVPGPPSLPWEIADVPHGTLHRHFYRSGIVGDDRDYYVYTPPGYDTAAATRYPVLYLLHGFSDEANGWTAVGRAHVILDNLIAQGKAKPMLMVMPLGYGAPEIVRAGFGGFREPGLRQRNCTRRWRRRARTPGWCGGGTWRISLPSSSSSAGRSRTRSGPCGLQPLGALRYAQGSVLTLYGYCPTLAWSVGDVPLQGGGAGNTLVDN
jgi:hypothetical protein